MFKRKNQSEMDLTIEKALSAMRKLDPSSEEYATIAKNVEVLMRAKANKPEPMISGDAVLAVIANLAGIGLVMNHERLNVISTKAFSFIPKLKI